MKSRLEIRDELKFFKSFNELSNGELSWAVGISWSTISKFLDGNIISETKFRKIIRFLNDQRRTCYCFIGGAMRK